MVTTRPKASPVSYQEFSEEEEEEEGNHFTSQDTDGSDFEEPRRKKAKKNKASAKSQPKDPKALLMKTFFEVLPLDIIFEIFSYLHPINLLNLARTNKLLRLYLMRRSSSYVWKRARKSNDTSIRIPECPEDQSEPQWAHLIFNRDCAICGNTKAQTVIWELRIRGCDCCLKTALLDSKAALQRFGYVDVEELSTVLAVLPYSQPKKYRFRSKARKFYLASSIEAMIPVIEDYLLRIDACVPDAKKDYDEWVENKKAEVGKIMGSGATYRYGFYAPTAKSVMEAQKKEARRAAIIERLLALGHKYQDVVAISGLTSSRSTELTENVWRKIKPRCEAQVANARRVRIYEDRVDIIEARKDAIRKLYLEHRASLGLSKFAMFPPVDVILDIPELLEAIEREDHDKVIEEHFAAAMKTLPAFAVEWTREKRGILLGWFGAAPSDEHILPLATSVLVCLLCGHVVSPDDTLGEHHCGGGSLAELGWSFDNIWSNGYMSQAATELVRAVGLNPKTATALEMDGLDARFTCACSPGLARNWRNCVVHAGRVHSGTPVAEWTTLLEEVTERVRELESTVNDSTPRLTCGWCNNVAAMTLDGMRDHVSNLHRTNIVGSDYSVDMKD